MKSSVIVGEFMNQIKLATINGIKGKDDCIDTISMLAVLKAWKPSDEVKLIRSSDGVWEDDEYDSFDSSPLNSYIV